MVGDIIEVGNRRIQIRISHCDAAAKATPKIELPRGVHAQVKLIETTNRGGHRDGIAGSYPLIIADSLLELRKQIPNRDATNRVCLLDSFARLSQRQILLVGLIDQTIQYGIV